MDDVREIVSHPLLAAASGSAFAATKAFPGATWVSKLFNFFFGTFAAVLGGVALTDFLHIESRYVSGFITFVIGIGAILMMNMLITWFQAAKMSDIPVIGKWFSKEEG